MPIQNTRKNNLESPFYMCTRNISKNNNNNNMFYSIPVNKTKQSNT